MAPLEKLLQDYYIQQSLIQGAKEVQGALRPQIVDEMIKNGIDEFSYNHRRFKLTEKLNFIKYISNSEKAMLLTSPRYTKTILNFTAIKADILNGALETTAEIEAKNDVSIYYSLLKYPIEFFLPKTNA